MPKLNEIADKINKSIPELENLQYEIEQSATQTSFVLLMDRTFASSGGFRDSKGKKLKGYSNAYAKKREKAGYQIKEKDLQITGALMESIQVGESNGRPALGFVTERSAEIAGFQEEQNKDLIFILSDEEREEVIRQTREFAIEKIQEITKSWL